jgi:hypothetical protein
VGVRQVRRALEWALAGGACVGLAWSGWKDVPHSWRLMRNEHALYAGYTRAQRDDAYGALIPIRMDILGFWRRQLQSGDRYWIQIPDEAFSANGDKRFVVRSVSHLYLLPATEASSLRDATVVLSWDADPGTLGLRYSQQARAGLQLVFVSRIDRGA